MAAGDPTLDQIKSRITRLLSNRVSLNATVYRSTTPKYANEADLLTGLGSKLHGGRWNPIGIAVVYGALTPETALAETLAHNRYFGIPLHDAMPRTFVAIEVKLRSVLDLRDGAIRQSLRISLNRMLKVDWRKQVRLGREPITQRIGRAALEVQLEGLIVPSAASPGGHNLLIFPINLQPGSVLKVLNAQGL